MINTHSSCFSEISAVNERIQVEARERERLRGEMEADINYSPVIWNPWAKIIFAWLALGSGSEWAVEWVNRAS